jgi:hypothetical protein
LPFGIRGVMVFLVRDAKSASRKRNPMNAVKIASRHAAVIIEAQAAGELDILVAAIKSHRAAGRVESAEWARTAANTVIARRRGETPPKADESFSEAMFRANRPKNRTL